jgi:hypothetical protein
MVLPVPSQTRSPVSQRYMQFVDKRASLLIASSLGKSALHHSHAIVDLVIVVRVDIYEYYSAIDVHCHRGRHQGCY